MSIPKSGSWPVWYCVQTLYQVALDFCQLPLLALRSRGALPAENLFLRKRLALFEECKVKPHRPNDSTRWRMASLGRLFNWRNALVVVKPDTLIRWYRNGFRLFWRWKSRPTKRPRLPKDLQNLIRLIVRSDGQLTRRPGGFGVCGLQERRVMAVLTTALVVADEALREGVRTCFGGLAGCIFLEQPAITKRSAFLESLRPVPDRAVQVVSTRNSARMAVC